MHDFAKKKMNKIENIVIEKGRSHYISLWICCRDCVNRIDNVDKPTKTKCCDNLAKYPQTHRFQTKAERSSSQTIFLCVVYGYHLKIIERFAEQ